VWEITHLNRLHRYSVRLAAGGAALVALSSLIGCRSPAAVVDDTALQQSISLLIPSAVNIVEPFTTWADLDEPRGIDGIAVYAQPVNRSGDAIQAAGRMYIELYVFQPASADPKGARLELWEVPILTAADQQARWNRATQMYELRLGLSKATLASISAGQKFVLSLTYNSPLGEHLTDEYILKLPLAVGRASPG
jgi:hypothetical protein